MVFHDYLDTQSEVYPLEEPRVVWETIKRQSVMY